MNNDLISREALKKTMCIKFYTTPYYKHILDEIDNAPTVAEDYDTGYQDGLEDGLNDIRPQGEWVEVIDYSDEYEKCWHYECSKCKNAPYYGGDIGTLHFCPNCGADMRGKEE